MRAASACGEHRESHFGLRSGAHHISLRQPIACTAIAVVIVGSVAVRSHSICRRFAHPCGRRRWPSLHQFIAVLATSALRSYAAWSASLRVSAWCLHHRTEAQPGVRHGRAVGSASRRPAARRSTGTLGLTPASRLLSVTMPAMTSRVDFGTRLRCPAVLPIAAVHSLPGCLARRLALWRARRARVLPGVLSAPPSIRLRGVCDHGVCSAVLRALLSCVMHLVSQSANRHRVWPNPAFEGTRRGRTSTCRMPSRRAPQLVRWAS